MHPVPIRKEKPLWERFLNLDANDHHAVRKFMQEEGLDVGSIHLEGEGEKPAPTAESPSGQSIDMRSAHGRFAEWVRLATAWEKRDKALSEPPWEVECGVMQANLDMSELHPMLGLDEGGNFVLRMPGDRVAASDKRRVAFPRFILSGYGDASALVASVYLNFARHLAGATVGTCPQCGQLFGLTKKQVAARDNRGANVFCSTACRVQYHESRPERKRQKIEAVQRFRKRFKSRRRRRSA